MKRWKNALKIPSNRFADWNGTVCLGPLFGIAVVLVVVLVLEVGFRAGETVGLAVGLAVGFRAGVAVGETMGLRVDLTGGRGGEEIAGMAGQKEVGEGAECREKRGLGLFGDQWGSDSKTQGILRDYR